MQLVLALSATEDGCAEPAVQDVIVVITFEDIAADLTKKHVVAAASMHVVPAIDSRLAIRPIVEIGRENPPLRVVDARVAP